MPGSPVVYVEAPPSQPPPAPLVLTASGPTGSTVAVRHGSPSSRPISVRSGP